MLASYVEASAASSACKCTIQAEGSTSSSVYDLSHVFEDCSKVVLVEYCEVELELKS